MLSAVTFPESGAVREITYTVGTGDYELDGAVAGYFRFNAVYGDGEAINYQVTDGANVEIGIGTFTFVTNTLSRDRIWASSNGGAAISWTGRTRPIVHPLVGGVLGAICDLIEEHSYTQGTGAYTLAGATAGNFRFQDGLGTNVSTGYHATNGAQVEIGTGTFDGTSGLTRDSIQYSSNDKAPVSWGSKTRVLVRPMVPASQMETMTCVPVPVLAYSNRRVTPAYRGPLYTIRRASDNVTQIFWPTTTGDAPQSDITTFLGGSTGFVSTWNDQGGFGLDAKNATSAQQPQWLANINGTRPGLDFGLSSYSFAPGGNFTQQVLTSAAVLIAGSLLPPTSVVFLVMSLDPIAEWPSTSPGSGGSAIILITSTPLTIAIAVGYGLTSPPPGPFNGLAPAYISTSGVAEAGYTATFDTAYHVWDTTLGNTQDGFEDGAALPLYATQNSGTPATSAASTTVKIGNNVNVPLYGVLQEIQIYSALTAVQRAAVRADITAYYGLV